MTDSPLSTMAAPTATNPSRANNIARTASSNTPATLNLVFCMFFPTPMAPAKFNPIVAMKQLFWAMLKDKPSLVLRTAANNKQINLMLAVIPTGKNEFKKFFKVSTTRNEKQNKTHICIGCHVLSNWTLGNIKFRSTDGNLLAWLKKEKIFIESDSLGINRLVTIGYFTKIASSFTHLANFRNHLVNQLMLVEIDTTTAIKLAPHLKQMQLDTMMNGNNFVTILPEFEIYHTHLSHGCNKSQVSTDVLGAKSAPKDAKLLGKFFTHMASVTNNDQRDGVFLPKEAAYLLGPQTYTQVLQENKFFLTTVATIPVNLEYQAWFAIIDPNQTSDNEPISLHDHLLCKPWFLCIELVMKNKCLLITTQNNLPEAHEWINTNLQLLIRQSSPPGIDPPASLLPWCLNKPVYSQTSITYADILKQQFSLAPMPPAPATTNNRPPRKRQATIIDYDSDQSADSPTPVPNSNSHPGTLTMPSTTTTTMVDYAAELKSLKNNLQSLWTLITTAVEQLKTEITSLHATMALSNMETDVDHSTETTPDISELIADLKHDIVTIALEMQAKFAQQEETL